jgi:hypothetical protein
LKEFFGDEVLNFKNGDEINENAMNQNKLEMLSKESLP